jgi:hypothetical protein
VETLTACPICDSRDHEPVVEIHGLPVLCNVFWLSPEEARRAPKATINLVHCQRCTHFFNASFDPNLGDYGPEYENSLHFSEGFHRYATELAHRLVTDHDLQGKEVVEVGCGRGEFLRLLCEAGGNRGLGFDRIGGWSEDDEHTSSQMRFVPGFPAPDSPGGPVDFLCSRQLLEHLGNPMGFMVDLRGWLGDEGDPVLYFEVPNGMYTMERGGVWDLIYEHLSYFTVQSLHTLFALSGFSPYDCDEAFGGQYLSLLARVLRGSSPKEGRFETRPSPMQTTVASLGPRFRSEVQRWGDRIEEAEKHGTRLAVWGGGSKGVTFLNLLDPGPVVQCVVDVNPRKQGRFVPGTAHEVVAPDGLLDHPPHGVVITNPLYREEIEAELRRLGIEAQIYQV